MRSQAILTSEPDLSDSLHSFRERLAETVAWCQRAAVPDRLEESLRSTALAPPPASSWIETVRAVGEARLHHLGRSWRRSLDPLGGGLLLVYFPTSSYSRGAAHSASRGYFDNRDAPPWDTWVAFVEEEARSYLVAWAPPDAMPAVLAAVEVAKSSLNWLDSSDVALNERLRVGQPG